jgi:hypothetical protein
VHTAASLLAHEAASPLRPLLAPRLGRLRYWALRPRLARLSTRLPPSPAPPTGPQPSPTPRPPDGSPKALCKGPGRTAGGHRLSAKGLGLAGAPVAAWESLGPAKGLAAMATPAWPCRQPIAPGQPPKQRTAIALASPSILWLRAVGPGSPLHRLTDPGGVEESRATVSGANFCSRGEF